MNKNDITVLMCAHLPNLDSETLFFNAFGSLVCQSDKNFKILIVLDECRSDFRYDIDQYVRDFNSEIEYRILLKDKKTCLADAKNFGLKHVSTEWVMFLDADDMYHGCKVEIQRSYIEKMPNVDFFFTQAWDLHKDGHERPNCFSIGQYRTHYEIKTRITHENVLCHGSAMIKMDALRKIGYYNNDRQFLGREDWKLWTDAIFRWNYEFYNIPERLYVYRLGSGVKRD